MRVTPVSGDLLVKLAIGAVCVFVAYELAMKAGGAAADLAGKLKAGLDPTSDTNWAYQGVNALGGAFATSPTDAGMTGAGTWNAGQFLTDVLHPIDAARIKDMSGPVAAPTVDTRPAWEQALDASGSTIAM
jgi:hypothetical protein